jgi:uncharacterized protein (TIGR02678 family)
MSGVAEQIVAERREAMRALLAKPLLPARGADGQALALVRVHAEWLRQWLGRNCGWSLHIEPELARLRKTPADLSDGTRGALDRTSGLLFSRRRYVLLCLALATLERADRQTTLGNVAGDVLAAVAGEPAFAAAGLSFELDSREARRDLVHVIRLLLEACVLVRVHGQEDHFIGGRGDVLYNVNRAALAAFLAVRRGPSTVAARGFEGRIAAIAEEPHPEGDEARNRQLRIGLTRRLLDDAVVYFQDLDEEERAYLASQRAHLLRQIHEATGLVGEVRREGIALVDPEGTLCDLGMPEEGTEGHATLLVAEFLAAQARGAPGDPRAAQDSTALTVPREAVVAHLAAKKREHRAHWRKEALSPGAEEGLARDALARLEALRLIRMSRGGITPLPALGRFRLLPPTMRSPRGGTGPLQKPLFE